MADPPKDVWHLGELPGDDHRVVRDQNGLTVKRYATTSNALRAIVANNDKYGVADDVEEILRGENYDQAG
jgi:hypothetical protein